MTKDNLLPSLLGIAAFGGSHLAFGWWGNTGPGVAAMLLSVLGGAIVVGPALRRLVAFYFAAVVTMVTILFFRGPGTIFPIVIAIGVGFMMMTVVAGWVIRSLAELVWTKLRPHHQS